MNATLWMVRMSHSHLCDPRYILARSTVPKGQLLELPYSELAVDKLGTVERCYKFFGWYGFVVDMWLFRHACCLTTASLRCVDCSTIAGVTFQVQCKSILVGWADTEKIASAHSSRC